MAAGIQEQILTELKSILEGITTANGYRTDVADVEWAARDWCDVRNESPLPWLGIVPQEDNIVAHQGISEGTWSIDIIAHLGIDPVTMVQAVKAASDMFVDLRRILLSQNCGNLGLTGVEYVELQRWHPNIGSTEAFARGITTAVYRIVVRYQEAYTAA